MSDTLIPLSSIAPWLIGAGFLLIILVFLAFVTYIDKRRKVKRMNNLIESFQAELSLCRRQRDQARALNSEAIAVITVERARKELDKLAAEEAVKTKAV